MVESIPAFEGERPVAEMRWLPVAATLAFLRATAQCAYQPLEDTPDLRVVCTLVPPDHEDATAGP